MLYYTIIPIEDLFGEEDAVKPEETLLEVKRSGLTMLVTPLGHGKGQIQRLISSNPDDYMNPALQPGSEIIFGVHDVITEL